MDWIAPLKEELAAAQALAAVLQAEYAALCDRDATALERLTAAKLQHVDRLQQLSTRREQRLQAQRPAGAEDDTQTRFSIDACCRSAPPASQATLRQLWSELQTVCRAAWRQNQINGAVIQLGQSVAEQTLTLLLGGPSAEPLYRRDARLASDRGSTPLATA